MKTLTLFKLQSDFTLPESDTLLGSIEAKPFREVKDFEKHTIGFSENIFENTLLSEGVGVKSNAFTILSVTDQIKVVDKYSLKKLVNQRLDELEEDGKEISKEVRKAVTEGAEETLLPTTPPKAPKSYTVLIRNDGLVFIDAKLKKAEEITAFIREVLGSFQTIPVETETSPTQFMGLMVQDDIGAFTLADKAKLSDPVGITHILTSGSLYDSDIEKYVTKQNMTIEELQLDFDGIAKFTLKSDLAIDGIRLDKGYTETAEDKSATFLLTIDAVNSIVNELLGHLNPTK